MQIQIAFSKKNPNEQWKKRKWVLLADISPLMVLILIICYIGLLKTMQPNNSDLDNVKYGKLPRSVGEAKNVSVNMYILKLITLYVCTVQLPCIWNNCHFQGCVLAASTGP